MTNALVLTSSAAGPASVSSEIVHALVAELRQRDPSAIIAERDLGGTPVPHLTPESLPGLAGKTEAAAAAATARLAAELVDELQTADLIVIGSPMYNFGITSTLKAWFDHVLRAGVTFQYTANGPVGLLTGKRAIVVESRGGFYSDGPAAGFDSQEPHLRTMLGFMGITDVTFVRAERLAIGPDERSAAIAGALDAVRALDLTTLKIAA